MAFVRFYEIYKRPEWLFRFRWAEIGNFNRAFPESNFCGPLGNHQMMLLNEASDRKLSSNVAYQMDLMVCMQYKFTEL